MNEPYAVISTHTLTWSVTHGTLVQRQISNFNSHAHVERDRFKKMALKVWQYFNSHAHVERDRILAVLPADFVDFNSHAHVERDWVLAEHWHRRGNFNSHAHVERDKYLKWQEDHQEISTHTLTWSVTEGKHVLMNVSAFQLTRSRGAWQVLGQYWLRYQDFNSHAHVERDRVLRSFHRHNPNFNSHAHVERD